MTEWGSAVWHWDEPLLKPICLQGSASLCALLATQAHRRLGLFSHYVQNKSPATVIEHPQQGLVTALEVGAMSLSFLRREEAARHGSFRWFLFAGRFCSLPLLTAGLCNVTVSSPGHKEALFVMCTSFPGVNTFTKPDCKLPRGYH